MAGGLGTSLGPLSIFVPKVTMTRGPFPPSYGELHPEPPDAYHPTDMGKATSSHPHDHSDCTVRALAAACSLSYDQSWDEMAALGRPPFDGFDVDTDFLRKVSHVRDWESDQVWYFRATSLGPMKGFRRVYATDIPLLFGTGRWVFGTEGHIEAWIDGVHWEAPSSFALLKPSRMFYTAHEALRLPFGMHLWEVNRCYMLRGECYRSRLGVVPGVDLEAAYRAAAVAFENKVGRRGSDLLVEYLLTG